MFTEQENLRNSKLWHSGEKKNYRQRTYENAYIGWPNNQSKFKIKALYQEVNY